MVTLFRERDADKRDYGFAFGAFKDTACLGLTMATNGQPSPLDGKELRSQILDGSDIAPASQLSPASRASVEEMLDTIERTAATNFKTGLPR